MISLPFSLTRWAPASMISGFVHDPLVRSLLFVAPENRLHPQDQLARENGLTT